MRRNKRKKRTVAKITPEMSEFWLDFYTTISDEKNEQIFQWLIKKGFYDTNNAGKIKFFLKIDGNKYPEHKSYVWRILYLNRMLDKQK